MWILCLLSLFLGIHCVCWQDKDGSIQGFAVTSWPVPDSHNKWQRFLSFANFYRHFIRNYSCVTTPSHLPKSPSSGPLQWTRILRFTSAPILQMPDLEFSVCSRSGCFRWRFGGHPPPMLQDWPQVPVPSFPTACHLLKGITSTTRSCCQCRWN